MKDRLLAFVAQTGAGYPAGGHIDHAQRVQELAGATPTAVRDKVHLQKPGPSIAPIRKRADGDLAFEQRAGLCRAEATSLLHVVTRGLQRAIYGGCTHAS